MTQRQMKLGLNLVGNGAHGGGWRMPASALGSSLDFALWKRLAILAEKAKFHFMFWADGAAVRSSAKDDTQLSYESRVDVFEPLTLVAALSAVTEHLGFVATASTTYNDPYTLARKLASLDHISGGRIGWNVVTSWSEQEALNYGREAHMEHGARYRRAGEFVDVAFGLWDSWEDDAFIRNKGTGQYFDPTRLHTLNHRGENFSVRGPLNVARPIQGYPVIAQAGASGPGQELAGRIAELVYIMHDKRENAAAYYASVKASAVAHGRSPDGLLVMPGVMPIMGRTMQEARDLAEQLDELVHPQYVMASLNGSFGDLSGYALDDPAPPPLAESNSMKSNHALLKKQLEGKTITVRELIRQRSAPGHRVIVGTPQTVADEMEDWFAGRVCDGWNITPPFYPGPVEDVFELLVPELQRRGVFHTGYEGRTLRESLGLPRPAHPVGRASTAAAE